MLVPGEKTIFCRAYTINTFEAGTEVRDVLVPALCGYLFNWEIGGSDQFSSVPLPGLHQNRPKALADGSLKCFAQMIGSNAELHADRIQGKTRITLGCF